MNINGLDLNLMFALDALLREGNVTRAAERLNLTQPTLSQSLARLRKHFDDDLLRRFGNDMELTPLAKRLQPIVAEALDMAERTFTAHQAFNPTTSTRRFSVATGDYGIRALGAQWSGLVSKAAPNMRVVFRSIDVEQLQPYETRTRDVDGVLAPHGLFPPEMPHMDLLTDRWVIIADEHNRALSAKPTARELSDLPWVSTFETPLISPSSMQRNEWATISRHVSVVIDRFSEMPMCVRGTSRVALVQQRLLEASGPLEGIRVLPQPFKLRPFVLAFWWHPSFNNDVEHLWMRSLFQRFRDPALAAAAAAGEANAPAGPRQSGTA